MDEQNQIDRMLLDYIDENRDRLVEHVRQMVRIDSVEREARDGAPFGPGVKKALDLALSISRDMGFETVDLDGYIGYAFYGRGEDYVCAMGHVDVVPAGEGWKEPPFNGHMENGVIYSLLFTDLRRTANILWYTVSGEGQLCASPAQGNTWVHFSTL